MTYSKRQIREAIQDLTECASTWLWDSEGACGQVSEDPGLAEEVYLTMSGWGSATEDVGLVTHTDTLDVDGVTIAARMLEGAQLLREGWLPGDPLHWLPGHGG